MTRYSYAVGRLWLQDVSSVFVVCPSSATDVLRLNGKS